MKPELYYRKTPLYAIVHNTIVLPMVASISSPLAGNVFLLQTIEIQYKSLSRGGFSSAVLQFDILSAFLFLHFLSKKPH